MAGWRGVGEGEGVGASEVTENIVELVSLSPEPWLPFSRPKSLPLKLSSTSSGGVPANQSPAVSARLAMSGKEMDSFLLFSRPSGGGLATSSTVYKDSTSVLFSVLWLSISMYAVDTRGVTSGVSSNTSALSPLRELPERSEMLDKWRVSPFGVRWVVNSERAAWLNGGEERRSDFTSVHWLSVYTQPKDRNR